MNIETTAFKKEMFETLYLRGNVKIYVEPHPAVVLVDGLQLPVALEYGRQMPIPVEDFKITEIGIFARLSFNRTPHDTFVPWAAVSAMWLSDDSFFTAWGSGIALMQPPSEEPTGRKLSLVPPESS